MTMHTQRLQLQHWADHICCMQVIPPMGIFDKTGASGLGLTLHAPNLDNPASIPTDYTA